MPMRTFSWILLTLLVPQASPQDRAPASLDGIVVSFGTNNPIAKADVELRRTDVAAATTVILPPGVQRQPVAPPGAPPASRIITTSADGKYSFKDVLPGNYRLYVTRASGYIPGEYGQRSPAGTGTPLTLGPGQTLSNVKLSMAPTASVSGRVVDGAGDPIAYARVQALRVVYQEGQPSLVSVRAASTDDRGEYRIYSLPPGDYYVASRPFDSRATRNFGAAAIVRFGGGQGADAPLVTLRATDSAVIAEETWRSVFYPASFDARSAQTIPLRMGENLRGIDINLGASATPARHVRGTVIDMTTGLPAANATVRLLPRYQLTTSVIMPSGSTDTAGRFDVAGVLSGSYSVIVTGTAAGPAPATRGGVIAAALSGYAVVDVGNSDIEGLQIAALRGVDIPLNVTVQGGTNDPALLKNLGITLHRKPVVTGAPVGGGTITAGWPGLPQLSEPRAITTLNTGGTLLRGVSLGDFTVEVTGLPQGAYVKSISLGRTDVLAEGIRVIGPPANPMELSLATDSGTLTGRVFDVRQEPAGNVTAVLVPDPARRSRVDLFQNIATDGRGGFRFENIAPGEYKLFAWEEVVSGAWHDADFLRSRENLGTLVRIAPGQNEPADVKVIPWNSGQ
jgi:protocatechuate 3,4-dioxygenase beta subunit